MYFENYGDKFMLRYCLLLKVLEKLSESYMLQWKEDSIKNIVQLKLPLPIIASDGAS